MDKSAEGIIVYIIKYTALWFALWFFAGIVGALKSGDYNVTLHATTAWVGCIVGHAVYLAINAIAEKYKCQTK